MANLMQHHPCRTFLISCIILEIYSYVCIVTEMMWSVSHMRYAEHDSNVLPFLSLSLCVCRSFFSLSFWLSSWILLLLHIVYMRMKRLLSIRQKENRRTEQQLQQQNQTEKKYIRKISLMCLVNFWAMETSFGVTVTVAHTHCLSHSHTLVCCCWVLLFLYFFFGLSCGLHRTSSIVGRCSCLLIRRRDYRVFNAYEYEINIYIYMSDSFISDVVVDFLFLFFFLLFLLSRNVISALGMTW